MQTTTIKGALQAGRDPVDVVRVANVPGTIGGARNRSPPARSASGSGVERTLFGYVWYLTSATCPRNASLQLGGLLRSLSRGIRGSITADHQESDRAHSL